MDTVKKYLRRYFIDAMGSMAAGLFASLLIGTIFKALGMIPHMGFLATIGGFAQAMAGPAMAAAIAYSLKAHPLVVFSSAAVGYAANSLGGAGGPLAVFFIAIAAAEIGMLVSKKTKVDIIVTPFVTIFVGGVLSIWVAPLIGHLVGYISTFIGWAALQAPFVTGIIVSVVIGVCLTLPISSAAICAGLVLTGSAAALGSSEGLAIAGAAAVAGCCAQMVGFAVISFRDNGWGGILSQGIEYHPAPADLDCPHACFCHNRTACGLRVRAPDVRRRYQFGHGYLRTSRTDRHDPRLVFSRKRLYRRRDGAELGRTDPCLLRASGSAVLGLQRYTPPHGLGKGRRHESGKLNFLSGTRSVGCVPDFEAGMNFRCLFEKKCANPF